MIQEIDVRALGDFERTQDLIVLLGDALERHPQIFDAIVTANFPGGSVDVSVAVEAPTDVEARELVQVALGEAMVTAGVVKQWVPGDPRVAVIA